MMQGNFNASPEINVPPLLITAEPSPPKVTTVLSSAGSNFESLYERGQQIGRGGFSTVYQCTERSTGVVYAVKIIDLRPLRLREKFSPTRIRREVDIMRSIHHPNIIQFVDVFETMDQLLVVMEYCPGKELFDVILAKKHMTEDEAKPYFSQIAQALNYLHSKNVIHRDVKPENILILNEPDVNGQPVAKLLDFGLSKNAETSLAKTFVGTPCYLAPEVELNAKGVQVQYGTPVDCWSLGAVLYVMLVARFPEFDVDPHTKFPKVKLPSALWGDISDEAKSLILSLMNPEPADRLTMHEAMQHSWLGRFRYIPTPIRLPTCQSHRDRGSTMDVQDMAQQLPAVPARMLGGRGTEPQNAVIVCSRGQLVMQSSSASSALQFTPLLNLQRSVATCFDEAHTCFLDMPEVAAQVRRGAMLCREQLYESIKMLQKVEQTAASVTTLLPDLELAVEEGEPALAAKFFNNVKLWVSELKELVTRTQTATRASMAEIQNVVDASVLNLSTQNRNNMAQALQLVDRLDPSQDVIDTLQHLSGSNNTHNDSTRLSQQQLMELFLNLFGRQNASSYDTRRGSTTIPSHDRNRDGDSNQSDSTSGSPPRPTVVRLDSESTEGMTAGVTGSGAGERGGGGGTGVSTGVGNRVGESKEHKSTLMDVSERNDSISSNLTNESLIDSEKEKEKERIEREEKECKERERERERERNESDLSYSPGRRSYTATPSPPSTSYPTHHSNLYSARHSTRTHAVTSTSDSSNDSPTPSSSHTSQLMARTQAGSRLSEALHKLRQVDLILVQLRRFWTETAGILDTLTREGQVAEDFIQFVHTPRLLRRFKDRIAEYRTFWEHVGSMCRNYLSGVREPTQRLYGFLEGDFDLTSAFSSFSTMSP
eukprot:CAMPEP_0182417790 /NCGR_PEP_ID=MMETSP1167-20130531/2209_1 /TAXON_ID=2988 /ORGANISM="Mallomonas Sp, Strain CCMP3275" /LENGTH=881 /DNA_ID=CAMNT_0024591555 /DNA_START=232 /DNA_END=2877 /DNA_ORIENTATION=-